MIECPSCLKMFTPIRSTVKYCSNACRQKAHRQRHPGIDRMDYRDRLNRMIDDAVDKGRFDDLLEEFERAESRLRSRRGDAERREEKDRKRRLFESAESYVDLGYWKFVGIGKSEQTGPFKAAEITSQRATVNRTFIVCKPTVRGGSYNYEEVKINTRKGYDGWDIWRPGEQYHTDPFWDNAFRAFRYQAHDPSLPTDEKAIRRIIRDNHPDKNPNGDQALYQRAVEQLARVRQAA